MEKELTLVVMAAGMGSRFGGLKQIEPVGPNGEFILDYSIYDALSVGFNKVVFIIKEENYDIFKETIGKRIEKKVKVEYVFQKIDDVPSGVTIPSDRIKPWGTAHAIYSAREKINGDFAVINADDFYGHGAYEVLANYFKSNNDERKYAMITYHVGNTMTEYGAVKRGICFGDNEGHLKEVRESSVLKNSDGEIIATSLVTGEEMKIDFATPAQMNLLGFNYSFMEYLLEDINKFYANLKDPLKDEYFITEVLFSIIKDNYASVMMLETDSKWYGLTYKEDIVELKNGLNKLINSGIYKEDLWS